MKDRIKDLGVNENNIIVVPNYLDVNAFKFSNNKTIFSKKILYIGGISEDRGIDIVIKGFEFINAIFPDWYLEIVGPAHPTYHKTLTDIIQNIPLKAQKLISIKPAVSQSEVPKLMEEASILLLPHKKSVQTDNSSPNKLFQYMFVGKPIVCSNYNSLIPIIEQADCGLIYQYDDPIDFSNKVMEIIKTDDFDAYKLKGKTAVEQYYNWSISGKVLESIY